MKDILIDLKLLSFLTLLSLIIMVFDNLGILNFPKSLLQEITVPIQYGLYQSGNFWGHQFEFIYTLRKASQENKALKVQLGELLSENASLKTKLSETEILVDQYNKLDPKTFDLLPSRVIGAGEKIILDKGTNDGVVLGQAVIFRDNLVGQIKSVSPKTAEVLVPEDPSSKLAVFSQNQNGKAKGILLGQFGSLMLMDKILHQEVIDKGDLIYSEGTEGRLPRGLVLGKVSEVMERQNEIFKQAKVSPLFEINDLEVVFILRT